MADYNGILLIDKPDGFTSFDVVAKMRGITRTRKIGHAGTLDPMATGVLPLFFGRAAKACDLLPRQDKCYEARLRLGLATDTQDITGTVLRRCAVTVNADEVIAAAHRLQGELMQVPPMYSAVKIGGQKLCDLARKGVEIERPARPVTVHSIECTAADVPEEYLLRVHCSKGTYIRTLVDDLGQTLGCGATLTALRRTMAAGFLIDHCITLDAVQQAAGENRLESMLMPVERAFECLPAIILTEKQSRMFQNGVRLDPARIPDCPTETGLRLAVYRDDRLFLGLAECDADGLRQTKLFALGG